MHTALASRTALLLLGFAVVVAAKSSQTDACALLSSEAIRRATGEQATNTKATSQTARNLRQSQCFYTLPTFTNSISVTLTSPAGLRRDAAREVWEHWFHRGEDDKDRGKPESEEEEAVASAAPVAGVGEEAFWVHSFVGNLYVRKGNRFLRISLGGKMNDDERQAKAKALAVDALRRLR
jgi:hypothetical protein